MIELFSRQPQNFEIAHESVLTPIPMEEEISSLSAILLDEEYYNFIQSHKTQIDEISLLSIEGLIALKVKAYLDLSECKSKGEQIDSKDIKKHKNDIFRLFVSLPGNTFTPLTLGIENDIRQFIAKMADEEIDLQSLNIKGNKEEMLSGLRRLFGI